MLKKQNSHQILTKARRSVPLTSEMKKALRVHIKAHMSLDDAAKALGINRGATLAKVRKDGTCASSTYNKILVLVNPDLAPKAESEKQG